MSPKSNQLFPSSQQCIYASLVKIHQLVQKIMQGNESGHRQDPHQKQYIPLSLSRIYHPTLWVRGYNKIGRDSPGDATY